MKVGKDLHYTIVINPSNNFGFVVEVGCGRFVYTSANDMLNDLREYLADPRRWEAECAKIAYTISPYRRDNVAEQTQFLRWQAFPRVPSTA